MTKGTQMTKRDGEREREKERAVSSDSGRWVLALADWKNKDVEEAEDGWQRENLPVGPRLKNSRSAMRPP